MVAWDPEEKLRDLAPAMQINLDQLLHRIGIGADSLTQVKLGRAVAGVAGSMTTVGVTAIICLTVVAYAFPPSWPVKAGAILLIAGLALYLLQRLEKLARERPDVVLLEGSEFSLSHQMHLRLRSKTVSNPPAEMRSEPYQAPPPARIPPPHDEPEEEHR